MIKFHEYTIQIQTHSGKIFSLQPFIQAYGVAIPAYSIEQLDQQTWLYTTQQGLSFTVQQITEQDSYLLMFHVKQPTVQLGIKAMTESIGPWYGMGERVIQTWPLNQVDIQAQPFITYDHATDGTLNIATPVWYAAHGIALLVDKDSGQLDVTMKAEPEGSITLIQHPAHVASGTGIDGPAELPVAQLSLRIIIAETLPKAILQTFQHLGIPQSAPPLTMFTHPIWTTWARYKMAIDQTQTLEFASEILEHGYPASVIEIDDRWQQAYGDLIFDQQKFPDPRAMVDQLHQQGFKVTLWIPPFFEAHSQSYTEAAAHNYLMLHPGDQRPYLTRWWQGWGALLDLTNSDALTWWQQKLQHLQDEYGIDGFKFDGGEGNFLPTEAITHQPITATEYTDMYVQWVAKHWQWTEVRAGWRSQTAPIFFREWDKWSRWGLDNGLHSVITQALALSIIGYPFILPDMIGGNAYIGERPDRELLIRWTQVTALMPAMQFSIPPWDYDQETIDICRYYAQLHTSLKPEIEQALAQVYQDGTPIIRPLWWQHPADTETWQINDQWYFGSNWLVAPVIQPGQTARSIYLPEGSWQANNNDVFVGPITLDNYPAPLETLPLFKRMIK